ncbi:MAG TPA: hypothetical protein IGS52_03245 [Oscillatoriaceae cyanobacterium M33_DOE_052]|nr:hypothetical protein [Oscillatoriaceae cyanobacterium M33_DOE_052]
MPILPQPHPELNQIPHHLHYDGAYPCPICLWGRISGLAMMDAFGCYLCRHIFTANLETQILMMADQERPLSWHWNGKRWQGGHRPDTELGWGIWLAAFALILLPPTLIWLGGRIFPPLPGSPLSWFPDFWAVSAFFGHLTIVIWLVVEYYQFPLLVFFRVWRRRLWSEVR